MSPWPNLRNRRNLRMLLLLCPLSRQYVTQFAARIRMLFPGCPAGREGEIAEHACRKYSERVGRSAAAKVLDEDAVRLEEIAHVRHRETRYDDLLARGRDRQVARAEEEGNVHDVVRKWATHPS